MLKTLCYNNDEERNFVSKEQNCVLDNVVQSLSQQFSNFSESFISYLSTFVTSFQSQITSQQQELISQSDILEELYHESERVKKLAELESKRSKHKEISEINRDSERENIIINKGDNSKGSDNGKNVECQFLKKNGDFQSSSKVIHKKGLI
jgi:hypothetical protein